MNDTPQHLHPLDVFRQRKGWDWTELSRQIGAKSARTARRYTLPESNPDHRVPVPPVMVNIYVVSAGEVQPNHFYALPTLPAPGGQVAA